MKGSCSSRSVASVNITKIDIAETGKVSVEVEIEIGVNISCAPKGSCSRGSATIVNNTKVEFLATMLPATCVKQLLIRGGIEQNPGPETTTEEKIANQNKVIAELCVNAPSNEVRDCIRLYNPAKEYEHHNNKFKSQKKATLLAALEYLSTPLPEKSTIKDCSHELICTIGTYLPDTCRMCEMEYTTKLGEVPLITCAKCGQGIHKSCLLEHLQLSTEEEHTSVEIFNIINPTNLPGLRYLCGACDEDLIPSTQNLNKKEKIFEIASDRTTPDTHLNGENTEDGTVDDQSIQNIRRESVSITRVDVGSSPHIRNYNERCNCHKRGILKGHPERQPDLSNGVTLNIPKYNSLTEDTPICKFYRQNRCRHKNPKDCSYSHPRPCKKLLQHGTNPQKGCTLGKDCSSFHPIMCRESLSRGTCYKEECNKSHVKGTKRTPSRACKQSIKEGICLDENCKLTHVQGTIRTEIRTANQSPNITPNQTPSPKPTQTSNQLPNHSSFLEELNSLKLKMLQAMDRMITNRLGNQLTNANLPYSEIVKTQCQMEQPQPFTRTCSQTSMQPGSHHFHRTLPVH